MSWDFFLEKSKEKSKFFLVYFLDKTMTHNVSCTKHSECDFFDCKGQCNLITNQCVNGVVNNNLQVITGCLMSTLIVNDRNEISPKPDRNRNMSFSPNQNRNSILKQYYKYFLNFHSLQCIFNKHWKYFLSSIMKSLCIVSFCGV